MKFNLYVLFQALLICLALKTPSLNAIEISQNKIRETAYSTAWLNLLHYRPVLQPHPSREYFSAKERPSNQLYESEIDGSAYFLHPNGRRDPMAELEKTIQSFQEANSANLNSSTGKPIQPLICRFPARRIFLESVFGPFNKIECEGYEHFKKSVAVRSVSVIFSSFYLNNPSSAYGHSFIRLNRELHQLQTRKSSELLDMGINYAAVIDTENPLLYAVKGFFGFFPGSFTSIPYFYKVREYNDFESRDLWEYELNLSPTEIELLVAHIWELGETFLWYYYLSENCSYHVLSAIDAARTRSSLLDRQRQIVIPSDTIRTLTSEPELVSGVHFRSSLRSALETRFESLNSEEKSIFLLESKRLDSTYIEPSSHFLNQLVKLSGDSQARVVDTLLDMIDIHFAKSILNPKSPGAKTKYAYQSLRANIQATSPKLTIITPAHQRPDFGHPSRRFSTEWGHDSFFQNYWRIGYRFSLHDALDPSIGYPFGAKLEMFSFAARLGKQKNDQRIWIDDATLFSIESLTPLSDLNHSLSWKARFGWSRLYDADCKGLTCIGPRFTVGSGYSYLLSRYLIGSFLPESTLLYSNEFLRSKTMLEAGVRTSLLLSRPWGGIRWDLFPSVRLLSPQKGIKLSNQVEARAQVFKDFSVGARFQTTSILRKKQKSNYDYGLSIYYYH